MRKLDRREERKPALYGEVNIHAADLTAGLIVDDVLEYVAERFGQEAIDRLLRSPNE